MNGAIWQGAIASTTPAHLVPAGLALLAAAFGPGPLHLAVRLSLALLGLAALGVGVLACTGWVYYSSEEGK